MTLGPCKECAVTTDLYRGYCGACLKLDGIKRVLAHESAVWKQKALDIIRITAYRHKTFSADEVKDLADDMGLPAPHHPNCWGGVFRIALSKGYMYQTGNFVASSRAKHHKQRIAEYTTEKPVDETALWKARAIAARDKYRELKKKYDELKEAME